MKLTYYKQGSILTATIFAMMIFSCSSGKVEHKSFTLEIGYGGGVTGLWNGYTLTNDGNVSKWRGATQGSNLLEYNRIKEEVAIEIWDRIEKSGILELKVQDPGNMSRYLKMKYDDKQLIFVWDQFKDAVDYSELNSLYSEIIGLLESRDKK